VTLLELILVMFLLSIVLGTGLGMFAALDLGKHQAAGLVKNVLRSAQNTAIASQAPASVRIDTTTGALTAKALHVIGTWHFENRSLAGAFGLDGRVDPQLFVPDGYIGGALSFTDRLGTAATIPVDTDAAYDFFDGFAVECVIRKEGLGGGRLLSIGGAIAIEVGRAGDVRGLFTPMVGKAGEQRRGPTSVVVQSPPGVISAERWSRLRLHYDRHELVLEIDGLPVARTPETAPVWHVEGPLILSDLRRPFPGSLDNLVISTLVADEEILLPERVTIEGPDAVYFSPGGGLDRARHREPVNLVLVYEDGSREVIGVGFYGTVE
jgi:type II secretory pathway pseudopilin PulG